MKVLAQYTDGYEAATHALNLVSKYLKEHLHNNIIL